jgi:hypothetical protein
MAQMNRLVLVALVCQGPAFLLLRLCERSARASLSPPYAGLFIRRILIGRATDFHIENIFRVNKKII